MLALFFLVAPDVAATQIAPQPSAYERQAPASRADWMGEGARDLTNPADLSVPNIAQIDPNQAALTPSSMCVVESGKPLPECAQTPPQSANTQLVLSDDIFSNSNNPEATCETVETVRRDANGNPQRVFATFCGEDVSRNDYREVSSPTGSRSPTRPTERPVGINRGNGAVPTPE